ncbi:MAG: pyridoxamine 5'-phosphate oxidase family protein [Rhodoglobus sp.]
MNSSLPRRERPSFPDGYGLPDTDEGMLEWEVIERRLVDSKHYWLATVRPDGRPHVVPRWGVWLDGRLYYDGSPATRHARNVEANPACTLTLEDGANAVILDGRSEASRADAKGLGSRISAAFAKYHDDGYSPSADAWAGEQGGGLRVFTPQTALAWTKFPTDATRFVFDGR